MDKIKKLLITNIYAFTLSTFVNDSFIYNITYNYTNNIHKHDFLRILLLFLFFVCALTMAFLLVDKKPQNIIIPSLATINLTKDY